MNIAVKIKRECESGTQKIDDVAKNKIEVVFRWSSLAVQGKRRSKQPQQHSIGERVRSYESQNRIGEHFPWKPYVRQVYHKGCKKCHTRNERNQKYAPKEVLVLRWTKEDCVEKGACQNSA